MNEHRFYTEIPYFDLYIVNRNVILHSPHSELF